MLSRGKCESIRHYLKNTSCDLHLWLYSLVKYAALKKGSSDLSLGEGMTVRVFSVLTGKGSLYNFDRCFLCQGSSTPSTHYFFSP